MHTRERCQALFVAILFPLIAACAPEAGEEGMPEDTMPGMEPGMEETRETEMGRPAAGMAQASMEAKNQSGVTGTLELGTMGDSLTVTVNLQGLQAGQSYQSHIHQGTCASPGGVVTPLQDVSGDTGRARSTVSGANLQAGQSYVVMVHGQDGQPIACGGFPADWRPRM